ncbi:GvpL/GvpF family gas vesicle protein [Prodigiosinella aquatilis]|nr:GvpL/GvpF family gas vesicle protein [Prodigiosinella sp. LS101]WJV54114.1 GvpL/GvpF family gas vesicle protein [Prodigiosinella sp. LS101]WJV58477.1 GvpL/GvpF family gas vesicle protein [Pectobacteriaceae bacterium C111]
MSLLLYGIVAEDTQLTLEPDGTPYAGEEPMQLIKAATLAALVKPCEADVSREPAAALAFGQQIMHVHQQTTIIPIRYGCVLADEYAVTQHLLNHEAHYQTQLVELENCDEMGIRLSLVSAEDNAVTTPQASGLDYLRSRKLAYAVPEHAERQAALLNNAFAGLYRRHCAEISMFNGQRTYLLSYLVPRTELQAFRDQFNALADNMTDIGFISGPWPPYNFAS